MSSCDTQFCWCILNQCLVEVMWIGGIPVHLDETGGNVCCEPENNLIELSECEARKLLEGEDVRS